jgi:pimeloyl-ACP methyl ester carboxylesterase
MLRVYNRKKGYTTEQRDRQFICSHRTLGKKDISYEAQLSIDLHEKLPINGTKLDIRIRGTKETNPVVLFLHGGPGACNRHSVLVDQAPLTDECTIVCLDQRGAGKSYSSRRQSKR